MSRSVPKHVIVLAHPGERSFSRAVADRYVAAVSRLGHQTLVRDLYAMGFDPVLAAEEQPGRVGFHLSDAVAGEVTRIADGDVFVLVYPVWFGGPPAILKGYVDRVLGAGFAAHELHVGERHRFLAGKALRSFASSGTTSVWSRDSDHWLAAMHLAFESYIARVFGMSLSTPRDLTGVDQASTRQVEDKLDMVDRAATAICSELEAGRAV